MAAALISVLAVGFVDAGSSSTTQIQSNSSIETQVDAQKSSVSLNGTVPAGVRNPGNRRGVISWFKRVFLMTNGMLGTLTGPA
jgi:hypothetical protein